MQWVIHEGMLLHPVSSEKYLKLGLAVRPVFVPFKRSAHQIIKARVPEIGHDVMTPSKRVQLVLLHGGLNLRKRQIQSRKEKTQTDQSHYVMFWVGASSRCHLQLIIYPARLLRFYQANKNTHTYIHLKQTHSL